MGILHNNLTWLDERDRRLERHCLQMSASVINYLILNTEKSQPGTVLTVFMVKKKSYVLTPECISLEICPTFMHEMKSLTVSKMLCDDRLLNTSKQLRFRATAQWRHDVIFQRHRPMCWRDNALPIFSWIDVMNFCRRRL